MSELRPKEFDFFEPVDLSVAWATKGDAIAPVIAKIRIASEWSYVMGDNRTRRLKASLAAKAVPLPDSEPPFRIVNSLSYPTVLLAFSPSWIRWASALWSRNTHPRLRYALLYLTEFPSRFSTWGLTESRLSPGVLADHGNRVRQFCFGTLRRTAMWMRLAAFGLRQFAAMFLRQFSAAPDCRPSLPSIGAVALAVKAVSGAVQRGHIPTYEYRR